MMCGLVMSGVGTALLLSKADESDDLLNHPLVKELVDKQSVTKEEIVSAAIKHGVTVSPKLLAESEEAPYIASPVRPTPVEHTVRGYRLNNPGNIRHNDRYVWQGASAEQPDPSFVQFDSMAWGVRAMGKTLMNYGKLHGLFTVEKIINRWAPPHDNNPTEAYVNFVARRVGVAPDDILDLSPDEDLAPLVAAIARFENGYDIEQNELTEGMRLV